MTDTTENTGADGIRETTGDHARGDGTDEVRDEVRLDLDEGRLDTWDEVRGDYALDPESDMARPALTESEDDDENDRADAGEDDEEDTEAEPDEGDVGTDRSDEEE